MKTVIALTMAFSTGYAVFLGRHMLICWRLYNRKKELPFVFQRSLLHAMGTFIAYQFILFSTACLLVERHPLGWLAFCVLCFYAFLYFRFSEMHFWSGIELGRVIPEFYRIYNRRRRKV